MAKLFGSFLKSKTAKLSKNTNMVKLNQSMPDITSVISITFVIVGLALPDRPTPDSSWPQFLGHFCTASLPASRKG